MIAPSLRLLHLEVRRSRIEFALRQVAEARVAEEIVAVPEADDARAVKPVSDAWWTARRQVLGRSHHLLLLKKRF